MFSFAVLRLALAPQNFWSLSVCEWRALVAAALPPGETMSRDALAALIQQHGGQHG